MLNRSTLVGRVHELPNDKNVFTLATKLEENKKVLIPIALPNNIADKFKEYKIKIGDIIGVVGRLDTQSADPISLIIVAEKISFLQNA